MAPHSCTAVFQLGNGCARCPYSPAIYFHGFSDHLHRGRFGNPLANISTGLIEGRDVATAKVLVAKITVTPR